MAGDLEGKVVVVTGGGDGIGRECGLAYARAGGRVAVLDNNLEAAERTAADLSSPGRTGLDHQEVWAHRRNP